MKIMSYNIQNYENNWETRIELIAQVINDAGADIVALNEVRGNFDDTANEAEVLRGALGGYWHLVVNEAMDYTPPLYQPPYVWEGLAILSREQYPFVQTGSLALKPTSDKNRRIVQFASFLIGNKPLNLFNYHATLDDGQGYDDNMQEVRDYIKKYEGSKLLVGDLNQPHTPDYCGDVAPCIPPKLQILDDDGWRDLWMLFWNVPGHENVGYTWPLSDDGPPTKRLDYQWATGDILDQFVSIERLAIEPVNGMYLSDHAAVISEFNV